MSQSFPEELTCQLCNYLLEDAVMLACCASSVCEACARRGIQASHCPIPDCEATDADVDDLIPNRRLRSKTQSYRELHSVPLLVRQAPEAKSEESLKTLLSILPLSSLTEPSTVQPEMSASEVPPGLSEVASPPLTGPEASSSPSVPSGPSPTADDPESQSIVPAAQNGLSDPREPTGHEVITAQDQGVAEPGALATVGSPARQTEPGPCVPIEGGGDLANREEEPKGQAIPTIGHGVEISKELLNQAVHDPLAAFNKLMQVRDKEKGIINPAEHYGQAPPYYDKDAIYNAAYSHAYHHGGHAYGGPKRCFTCNKVGHMDKYCRFNPNSINYLPSAPPPRSGGPYRDDGEYYHFKRRSQSRERSQTGRSWSRRMSGSDEERRRRKRSTSRKRSRSRSRSGSPKRKKAKRARSRERALKKSRSRSRSRSGRKHAKKDRRDKKRDHHSPSRDRKRDTASPSRDRKRDTASPRREKKRDASSPSREKKRDASSPSRDKKRDARSPSREKKRDTGSPSREKKSKKKKSKRDKRRDSPLGESTKPVSVEDTKGPVPSTPETRRIDAAVNEHTHPKEALDPRDVSESTLKSKSSSQNKNGKGVDDQNAREPVKSAESTNIEGKSHEIAAPEVEPEKSPLENKPDMVKDVPAVGPERSPLVNNPDVVKDVPEVGPEKSPLVNNPDMVKGVPAVGPERSPLVNNPDMVKDVPAVGPERSPLVNNPDMVKDVPEVGPEKSPLVNNPDMGEDAPETYLTSAKESESENQATQSDSKNKRLKKVRERSVSLNRREAKLTHFPSPEGTKSDVKQPRTRASRPSSSSSNSSSSSSSDTDTKMLKQEILEHKKKVRDQLRHEADSIADQVSPKSKDLNRKPLLTNRSETGVHFRDRNLPRVSSAMKSSSHSSSDGRILKARSKSSSSRSPSPLKSRESAKQSRRSPSSRTAVERASQQKSPVFKESTVKDSGPAPETESDDDDDFVPMRIAERSKIEIKLSSHSSVRENKPSPINENVRQDMEKHTESILSEVPVSATDPPHSEGISTQMAASTSSDPLKEHPKVSLLRNRAMRNSSSPSPPRPKLTSEKRLEDRSSLDLGQSSFHARSRQLPETWKTPERNVGESPRRKRSSSPEKMPKREDNLERNRPLTSRGQSEANESSARNKEADRRIRDTKDARRESRELSHERLTKKIDAAEAFRERRRSRDRTPPGGRSRDRSPRRKTSRSRDKRPSRERSRERQSTRDQRGLSRDRSRERRRSRERPQSSERRRRRDRSREIKPPTLRRSRSREDERSQSNRERKTSFHEDHSKRLVWTAPKQGSNGDEKSPDNAPDSLERKVRIVHGSTIRESQVKLAAKKLSKKKRAKKKGKKKKKKKKAVTSDSEADSSSSSDSSESSESSSESDSSEESVSKRAKSKKKKSKKGKKRRNKAKKAKKMDVVLHKGSTVTKIRLSEADLLNPEHLQQVLFRQLGGKPNVDKKDALHPNEGLERKLDESGTSPGESRNSKIRVFTGDDQPPNKDTGEESNSESPHSRKVVVSAPKKVGKSSSIELKINIVNTCDGSSGNSEAPARKISSEAEESSYKNSFSQPPAKETSQEHMESDEEGEVTSDEDEGGNLAYMREKRFKNSPKRILADKAPRSNKELASPSLNAIDQMESNDPNVVPEEKECTFVGEDH